MNNDLLLTLPDLDLAPRADQFPPKGFVIYGKSGIGKSTMAASFPGPKIVQSWDAEDKATPYWKRLRAAGGSAHPALNEPAIGWDLSKKQDGSLVIPVRYGLNKKGQCVLQVEDYSEVDPEHPTSYVKWLARMVGFFKEATHWSTFVTDSTTEMAICARNKEEFVNHPNYKDPGLWFAAATSEMERKWVQQFPAYKCNRVLLMHVKRLVVQTRKDATPAPAKEEFEGTMVYKLSAPGRLADADGVPSQYSEVYHLYLDKETDPKTGLRRRLLQTRLSGGYNAHTQIDAPDPCVPEYLALWPNYVP